MNDELIQLRRDLGLTQQQLADELGMALRSYQSIEAGESEYRVIHRLAVERVALMKAADTTAPMLAPQSVRDDAIELVRVGRLIGAPAFQKSPVKKGAGPEEDGAERDARFRAAYGVVGEIVLLANGLDHQLNHVLIQVLHLAETPFLEAVVATLDTSRKIEMLKERSKLIAQAQWQKSAITYLDKLEKVSKWRNIACHTLLIPDEKHGAVFVPTAAAKLLKTLKIGKEQVAQRVPYSELKSAISLGESALVDGISLIENFQKVNAERKKRFGYTHQRRRRSVAMCERPEGTESNASVGGNMTMPKDAHEELRIPNLNDLINDDRLARLFLKDARHCALQLWILQIKSEQSIENRVVYGRLVPYNYSDDCWHASDDDHFHVVGQVQAQIIRLNLYVKSGHCAELLRRLSAGRTISAISKELKFGFSEQLKIRFGSTALAADKLAYRPVAYLFNRDAYDRRSLSSPHGGSGALSASITRTDKGALFRVGQDYDVALTKSVVNHLNTDTGLDFGGADTTRFGDLELIVFPALDDLERRLLSVSWADSPPALVVRFNSTQVPHFSGFQFRLNIENDRLIVYSAIATAVRDEEGVFECKFELSNHLQAITDSAELEIFGFHHDRPSEGTLCCRWRNFYTREIHLQGNLVGRSASPVKFDWLEKTTRSSVLARVKAALTINRGGPRFTSSVGGREADPWVSANHDLTSLFARLHPPKSEARFFLRWGQSDGEGRLQFVEWFRALLEKYRQHQVFIFDPYFDAAGLGLMLVCAPSNADYIVFRSLPRPSHNGEAARDESDLPTPSRINNLAANCDHNPHLMKRFKLRIYGLKHGRLHDRYILIVAPDGLPIAGFNLSNSFQQAAENFPLLVTPIPADILLNVEKYKSGLELAAEAAKYEGETENRNIRLLFDSTASPMALRRYEPLRFLEKAQAGDVLSAWTGEPALLGLSGDPLKQRMAQLGLLTHDTLSLPEKAGLRYCLDQQTGDFTDFTATWEVLGEVLAHSRNEDRGFRGLEFEHGFLEFLARFLDASFNRSHDHVGKELTVIDAKFFRNPLETLLYSSYHPDHLFHPTKYTILTWPEYFAIKLLWWHAPEALLTIVEAQVASVPMEPQDSDGVRLSLLSQIASEISVSLQFDISEVQRDRLIRSNSGLLQWIGLNSIERQLEKPAGLAAVLQSVTAFSYSEQIRTMGWMVHRAARNSKAPEIYNGLVAALHGALPATIPANELRELVDSMRGHMRQLAWAEPWLFQDVVHPLLQSDRANTDHACGIWVQELVTLLEPKLEHQPRLFERPREGQMTNIAAFLFADSSTESQRASLRSVESILKRQQRILQQPLAGTSDWARWDAALVISMWILTFSRLGQYYLLERNKTNRELETLAREARELALVRPMNEWRSDGDPCHYELTAFLDDVEELMVSTDEAKGRRR